MTGLAGRVMALSLALTLVASALMSCTSPSDHDGEQTESAAPALPIGKGRLRVTVDGIPAGAEGKVQVKGGGQQWELNSSRDLDVAPGNYSVTVSPVRAEAATRHGAVEEQRVDVALGQTVDVDARYRITVPDTTKVIDDPARSPIIAVAGNRVVLSRGTYAEGLRPGDTILVGHGPKTPGGLCVRVVTVETANGSVMATTAPVRLLEALPDGVLKFAEEPVPTRPGWNVDIEGKIRFPASEPKVYLKSQMHLDMAGTDIEWRDHGDYLDVVIDPKFTADNEHGFEVPARLSDDKAEIEAHSKTAASQLEQVCGRNRVIKVFQVAVPVSCQLTGTLAITPTLKGGMAGKWTGSVAVNRRLHWRTDQATEPEYSSAKVRRDWAFTPSGFAEGSIEVEPGVRIGMVTGKGAILDLEIGVDVKFTATERVEAKAEPSGETVEAEISLGVSMGVTAKLQLLEPVFPAAGMDLDVWDHPIKTWSYTLKKADLNTRVPGYSHAQVDRALNDVLRGSLLNGYRSVSDEAECADPRRTCEFTTANGGRTNGFSAVASPNELVTLKATAYPSEQAARNAAARAARELSAAIGDGSFDIPPSEVRTVGPDGRVRKIRAHYGARGKGTVLAGIQASDWTGDGILRQYDDVPTARVREKLKHLGCTTRQLALARGCLWPASWQDNWMVVTKHNVVLKGRFRQPGPDRSTNTQYLSRLTLIMADFAHQIGAPTGAAGY